jgi:hypothetical protein
VVVDEELVESDDTFDGVDFILAPEYISNATGVLILKKQLFDGSI